MDGSSSEKLSPSGLGWIYMKNLFVFAELGWRNVWRNPRRTAVILAAVVIGVWSMVVLGGLMRGLADQLVENGIATLTGHIQVHARGYQADPVIEHSIETPFDVSDALLKTLPPGAQWSQRVRLNAIVSNARHSGGTTLVGIQPQREARISFIGAAVIEGANLEAGDLQGIVVGKSLAEDFGTHVGNKLVLMSQDTTGEIASRAFRIRGIFRAELRAIEKRFVFVDIEAAQSMLRMGNNVSEFAVLLPDHKRSRLAAEALSASLPEGRYEIQTWKELLPTVTAILEMYDTFIFLWFLVVFIAMGFGIVNTTLMAIFERIREFGLVKALGMKPAWIIRQVLFESSFILLMGTGLGSILGLLSILAISRTGIDLSSLAAGLEYAGMPRVLHPSLDWWDISRANGVVLLLGLLVSLYPAVRAARFTPVEALAHT